ncbi:MAG: SO_0444 family Cu/Zn efflux transporter, partial [Betaproteobacteria bacterium]
VLWGAAIGAPLPLCSCGVLPAALALKKQGATPGATVAFLVATPETGVDSISLSYALMDPVITVFRPLAAVVTAISAGLAANFLGTGRLRWHGAGASDAAPGAQAPHAHEPMHAGATDAHGHDHDHFSEPDIDPSPEGGGRAMALRRTSGRVYHYAFHQLLDDTSYWLMLGIVLSGVVAAALPASFFDQFLSGELTSMLVMLAIGIPIYTCASSSTPLAAAFVMKGLNPGAALVFLLAGPATNIGSLLVLLKFLGARVVAVYLTAIVVVTLAAGYALNRVYRILDLNPMASFGTGTSFVPEPLKVAGALLLIALLLLSMRRTHVPGEWIWLRDRFAALSGLRLTAARLAGATAVLVAALYGGSGLIAVQPGEVGIRMRFGQIILPALDPGLHFRLPWPFEAHRIIQAEQVRRIEFGYAGSKSQSASLTAERQRTAAASWTPLPNTRNPTGTMFQKEAAPDEPFLLTGDGNLIDLRWAVQFRVRDAVAFAFNVAEPEALVRNVSLATLRGVAARSGIDAIYTSDRSGVEQRVEAGLQRALDDARSGVEILSFQLLYVHPPNEVHDAFRDVASSQEDKLRTINRASIFAVETVNQAKAEAAAMIEQSLAFRDQQILHAQGDAANFGLKLDAYKRAPGLTRFRLQIESIEETLPNLQKFIMPGAGNIKDVDLWLLQPIGTSRSNK